MSKEQQLEREVAGTEVDLGALSVISRAEIDVQITTAKRFPRSVSRFQSEGMTLVTLTKEIADECIYALPRDGKTIEGPSARFGEIIAHAWGNCRAGARVVDDVGDFVTAQGIFHDLEKNVAITYEVKRRIVDKNNRRYSPDMVGVTANAACSIALRNAIMKGVPKAFWSPIYDKARETIMGTFETLANRRAAAIQNFAKFGVKPEQIFQKLDIAGEVDITLEHILTLRGLLTALREGDTSVEEMFSSAVEMPRERKAADTSAAKPAAAAAAPAPAVKPEAPAPAAAPAAHKNGPTLDDCKHLLQEGGKDALGTLKGWREHLLAADQIELDKLIEPIEKALANQAAASAKVETPPAVVAPAATPPAPAQAAVPAPAPVPTPAVKPGALLSATQKNIVKAKLKNAKVSDEQFAAKFGDRDKINADQFNTIQDWINAGAPA